MVKKMSSSCKLVFGMNMNMMKKHQLFHVFSITCIKDSKNEAHSTNVVHEVIDNLL